MASPDMDAAALSSSSVPMEETTTDSNNADIISSFTNAAELKEWALLHDKLFHCDVRNRLLQLEESIKIRGVKVS